MRPTSQDSYPVNDHSTIFPTLFMTCAKFDSLFMTVAEGRAALNIIYEGLFVEGLIDNDEKVPNRPRSISQYSKVAPRYLVLFSFYPSLFWELRGKRNY